jgi:hypothetical protein
MSLSSSSSSSSSSLAQAAGEIEWPECLSFVATEMIEASWWNVFSSGPQRKHRVFSISGGQLQWSYHPRIDGANLKQQETKHTSRVWSLRNVEQLDGFDYDPRDPGCSGHRNMNGGLLSAKIEVHSDLEITISAQLAKEPVRIEFPSKKLRDQFCVLVEKNMHLCQAKFQSATIEAQASMHDDKKIGHSDTTSA